MATNKPKYSVDGFTTLLGGVDESRQPLLLRNDQASRAINLTFRGGFARTRPAWMKRNLNFQRGEYGFWFINHVWQGADYYDDFMGNEKIVASVGGRIFLIQPLRDYIVTDITPRRNTTTSGYTADTSAQGVMTVADASTIYPGYPIYMNGYEFTVDEKSGDNLVLSNVDAPDGTVFPADTIVNYLNPNNPNQPLVWFVQAEQYMVIQDDLSGPIIYDGADTRRAVAGTEIPVGSAMAYVRGRIWIATNHGRDFVAGDISGGPTGVLGFTENNYLTGGGSFTVPGNAGKIRAMRTIMNLDTSLGQGPLQVLCDRAIFSVNAPPQRDLWAQMTSPIVTESLINFGATAQASTVVINGDLFFRAHDGWRSFIIARRDFGMWGNTPISREVSRILDKDTPELLMHSGAVVFDNRLLFTAVPQPGPNGVRHKCIVALDFDLISTIGGKSPPAYDGFWTGVEVTGFVAGNFAGRHRCFAFSHDGEGMNDFWEMTKVHGPDSDAMPIDWVIETRSLLAPSLKRLENAECWISEYIDEVTVNLSYKPDQYACWLPWDEKSICITSDQCDETDACESTLTGNMFGYKTRIGFGRPPETNNLANEMAANCGYSFTVRIAGSGTMQMDKFTISAGEIEEWPSAPPSDDRQQCNTIACCPPDPYSYVSRCGPVQQLVINPFGGGFRMAFRYDPNATHYVIYGFSAADGESQIVEYPPDDDDTWVNPDGWYTEVFITGLGEWFPSIAVGDTVSFKIQEVSNTCGQTRSTEYVDVIYTG